MGLEGGDQPLREWLEEVANPELRAEWISSFTYTTLARFAVMASKQFDGVYGSLAAAVRPFKNNRILRATARSTFDIRAMRRENMSLYLDFRIQQIASIGPIFNVLMVQFMDYMSRNMMKRGERRVLVLLDEFQNLGKLENALTVATVLGGYGIPCWFFVQSLRSIDNVYTREGRQTLVNSARAQIFLGAQDPEDQRYVSQLLGERKEVTVDKAVSTGVTLFDRKGALTLDGFRNSGADFMPEFKPYIEDGKTIVASPHKLYGPQSNDVMLQLNKQRVDKIVLAGMAGSVVAAIAVTPIAVNPATASRTRRRGNFMVTSSDNGASPKRGPPGNPDRFQTCWS